jgi:hypothetical protein
MGQSTNNNTGPGKNLDDLFRDAIGRQEFSPSPKIWKTLNWKLLIRELAHFNFTNVPSLALVSASAGLVIIASLTFWALQPNSSPSTSARPDITASAIVKPSIQQSSIVKPQAKPVSMTGKQAVESFSEAKRLPASNNLPKRNPAPASLIAANTRIENTLTLSSEPKSPGITNEAITTSRESNALIQTMDPLEFTSFDLTQSVDTISFIRSGEVFKYVRENAPVAPFFSANFVVAPEMELYRSGGTTTREFNYWANAELAYHFSRFSIHTVLGLGYTYDEGIYRMQYRSNDSVSFYKEVVGYYTDPVDPSKIIYITRNHSIYDSVTHIADDRTRNRYTYLQVPLLLGYNVFESQKFCLGIEAGPAISFLISEKKAQPYIDIPNGRLIQLQDNTPSKQLTNWQLWIRLSIEYQFTRNWGLVVKPYYKYFLTSPAQSTENGSPSAQAFGLDVGIQYLFGRKSHQK